MERKMLINKIMIIIAFILLIAGITLLSFDYVKLKIKNTFETVNLELYGNNIPKEVNQNTEEENTITNTITNTTTEEQKTNNYKPDYFGYIQIPKINLNQGLVPLNSRYNTVDMNIQTINPSDYPDVEKGNLILAAHSGTSSISYFKNLYQLTTNDKINILYNNQKYVYNIVKIYTVPKTGEVAIYRNEEKTTLTLITCTKNDDTTQTVYIAELI
ncbi:MAG: sortase [Bacilli bacterium]|nr:sortase [Bacilli bacterium]